MLDDLCIDAGIHGLIAPNNGDTDQRGKVCSNGQFIRVQGSNRSCSRTWALPGNKGWCVTAHFQSLAHSLSLADYQSLAALSLELGRDFGQRGCEPGVKAGEGVGGACGAVRSIAMKKLCTCGKREDEPHSPSSHLRIDPASTGTSAHAGCNLPDKDKKLDNAAAAGDLEKVKEYLQLKTYDVNIQDRKYRVPLHLACAYGHSNIVSLLIEKQCKVSVWDSESRSPLVKAVQFEKEDCATILLDGVDPNLVDLVGNTALHYAVCGRNVSLVRKLLEHHANLEAQNKDGYTPLLLAITENNAEIVEFLLKRGADVNALDKNQRTALMLILRDEPSSVSLLLQQEVDLTCQDIYGFTAEEYASFNGFTL
ncbi:LOW QUALITY PROTEIN: ankyrin repeat domain-containing protein 7 [Hipposideros larvatus]